MESSTGESGSPTSSSEYATVWSSPPKRPAGRTKVRETRHPIYRGVRQRGHSDRWICEVRDHNTRSRIWIGTFPTAKMAARAHDVAVIALRGTAACLNFTDSAWLIDIPSSFSSVQELKRTAVKVANTLHGVANEKRESKVSSTSMSRVSYDTEVVSNSSIFNVDTSDSDRFDQIEFEFKLDMNGEMDSGLYYASLAEALLMEPPVGSYGSCDEDEESTVMSLWNYIV